LLKSGISKWISWLNCSILWGWRSRYCAYVVS
jgi:hypothetical protein